MKARRTFVAAWRALRLVVGILALAFAAVPAAGAQSESRNGFDLRNASVPAAEILRGGPPRDGIAALGVPAAAASAAASWPEDGWVVGVAWEGAARAYPLAILAWHELVNDVVGGRPILVSYCPLCGSAMVFDRRVGGRRRRFGVSGLLYQSDLLMFDRESKSLWSQLAAEALAGPERGERLAPLRSVQRLWRDWKREHPETDALSRATGHHRRYGRSPYAGYDESEQLLFPAPLDPRYHPKMRSVGLRLADGTARVYPLAEVVKAGGRVDDSFAGKAVSVCLVADGRSLDVEAAAEVEVIEAFWFAWVAFHPQTTVYVAP